MREPVHSQQQAGKGDAGSAAEITDGPFVCCGCPVAEDIGVHQIERLVELLAPKECEDLLLALSQPEESIFEQLERLSPERNRLTLKRRVKRDAVDAVG